MRGLLVTEKDFWRDVPWSAALLVQKTIIEIVSSKSKVSHLDLVVAPLISNLVYEDVVRLNVSMDNLLVLEEIEDQ